MTFSGNTRNEMPPLDSAEGEKRDRDEKEENSRIIMDCQKQEPDESHWVVKVVFHASNLLRTARQLLRGRPAGYFVPRKPRPSCKRRSNRRAQRPKRSCPASLISCLSPSHKRGVCATLKHSHTRRHDDHHDKVLKGKAQRLSSRGPAAESRFLRTYGASDHHIDAIVHKCALPQCHYRTLLPSINAGFAGFGNNLFA
jgi:hypothetical protein